MLAAMFFYILAEDSAFGPTKHGIQSIFRPEVDFISVCWGIF